MTVKSTSRAQGNAIELRRTLEDRVGEAVLYRTIVAGPSGQRADKAVARVAYTCEGAFELAVWCPPGSSSCQCEGPGGYLARSPVSTYSHAWTVWTDTEGGIALAGWASSAAVGADVIINGVAEATGRHDHRRISGSFTPYVPQ